MIAPILNRFPLTHLRQWRLSRCWTLAELAAKSAVSESTVSRLERGGSCANFVTIRKLANAFAVNPSRLALAYPFMTDMQSSFDSSDLTL